jgi:hypothetical protein
MSYTWAKGLIVYIHSFLPFQTLKMRRRHKKKAQ